jgi:hypothetical protein
VSVGVAQLGEDGREVDGERVNDDECKECPASGCEFVYVVEECGAAEVLEKYVVLCE